MNRTIRIASDYTRYPGPRYARDGPFSGERFRDEVLADPLRRAVKQGETVTVVLDGVAGYGSSFLEEAFGGLVRKGFTRADLEEHLIIVAETSRFQHHAKNARRYIIEATPLERT